MISEQTLQEAARRLGEAARPAKVILFGSHARGDATEHSDVDFLVIEPAVKNKGEEMIRLHRAVGDVGFGIDVLVYSAAEVGRRGQVPGTVIYWALREGKVLYDAV